MKLTVRAPATQVRVSSVERVCHESFLRPILDRSLAARKGCKKSVVFAERTFSKASMTDWNKDLSQGNRGLPERSSVLSSSDEVLYRFSKVRTHFARMCFSNETNGIYDDI